MLTPFSNYPLIPKFNTIIAYLQTGQKVYSVFYYQDTSLLF